MKQTLANFTLTSLPSSGDAVKARLFADSQFQASTGELHLAGSDKENYEEFTLTISGNDRIFPTSIIDTNTDALDDPNSTYTLVLVNSRGRVFYTVFERWTFDAALGSFITYEDLAGRNQSKVPLRDDQVYTKVQTDNLVAGRTFATPATTQLLGVVEIDVPADDATHPKAVGSNSYAATNHLGIAKLSKAPASASSPIARGINDSTYQNPLIVNGSTLEIFGDSIAAGFNASPMTNSYANLVKNAMGWTLTNHGLSGSQVGDQSFLVYQKAVGQASYENYLFHIGIGDEIHYGADANKREAFRLCYLACLYWLGIPEASKLKSTNSGIAFAGGTWALANTTDGFTKFTYDVGATATAIVIGDAVYVGSLIQTGITAADYTITIDGVNYGTFTTSPPGGVDITTSGFGLAFYPVVRRIPLKTFGVHTVVVTVATASVGHPVYLSWIGGNGGLPSAPILSTLTPNVYALTILRQSAAGYAFYGGSDANVSAFNLAILEDVEMVKGDGFNIALINLTSSFNPETDLDDDLHPNNAGHAKIAPVVLSITNSAPNSRNRDGCGRGSFVKPITGSTSLNFTSKTAGQTEVLTITNAFGAEDGDVVCLGIPNALWTDNDYKWWVSAPSTISVRRTCINDSDPAAATIKFEVRKF